MKETEIKLEPIEDLYATTVFKPAWTNLNLGVGATFWGVWAEPQSGENKLGWEVHGISLIFLCLAHLIKHLFSFFAHDLC